MNSRKFLFLNIIAGIFLLIPDLLFSQSVSPKKFILYQSWISKDVGIGNYKGVLYEVKDSSVVFSNSLILEDNASANVALSEVPYFDIYYLKTRRLNKIKRSGIIGAVAGFTISGTLILASKEDMGEYRPLMFIALTPLVSGAGFLIGSLSGTKRIAIPVNRSMQGFNFNRNIIQKYSYKNESTENNFVYETEPSFRWTVGIIEGPSIPLGNFGDRSPDNPDAGYANIGYFSTIPFVNVRFNETFGISTFFSYSQYLTGTNESDPWHGLAGLMTGPMLFYEPNKHMEVDIKLRFGFLSSQYIKGEEILLSGKGGACNFSGSLKINFSKRWCAVFEPGIVFCHQEYIDGTYRNIGFLNFGLGVGYMFR